MHSRPLRHIVLQTAGYIVDAVLSAIAELCQLIKKKSEMETALAPREYASGVAWNIASGDDSLVRADYDRNNAWGMLTSIDLHGCDGAIIKDADAIKRFVVELCERIDMKRFGDCTVVNFGEDEKVAGYSMTQLIETSLISGHFANATNATYLDIFSCKYYNPYDAANFAKEFFKAADYTLTYTLRK